MEDKRYSWVVGDRVWTCLCEILNITEVIYSFSSTKMAIKINKGLLRFAQECFWQRLLWFVMIWSGKLFGDLNCLISESHPITRQTHLYRFVLIWPHWRFMISWRPWSLFSELLYTFEEVFASVLGDRIYRVSWGQPKLNTTVALYAKRIYSASLQLLNRSHEFFRPCIAEGSLNVRIHGRS
jgi:hypothetical protein